MFERGFHRRLVIVASGGFLLAAAPAPDGPLHVTIRNAAGVALECQVLGAHWYAQPPQSLPAGGQTTLSLHVTAGGLRMDAGLPVERIFCGFAGRAWQTRGELDLAILAAGGANSAACRNDGERVACAAP